MKETWMNINMENCIHHACQSDSDHQTLVLTEPRIVGLRSSRPLTVKYKINEILAGLTMPRTTFSYNGLVRRLFTLRDSHFDRRLQCFSYWTPYDTRFT